MIRTMTFAALSAAVLFGAASGAMAASKKGKEAYASAATAAYVDPRDTYRAHRAKNSDQTWCDADCTCNGWDQYLKDLASGKVK